MLNIHMGLPAFLAGGRRGRRQVSMALISGATHMLQWRRQWVAKPQGGANPIKRRLSWDCGLQLARMNAELVVIAGQLYCGEYVLAFCTHRQNITRVAVHITSRLKSYPREITLYLMG